MWYYVFDLNEPKLNQGWWLIIEERRAAAKKTFKSYILFAILYMPKLAHYNLLRWKGNGPNGEMRRRWYIPKLWLAIFEFDEKNDISYITHCKHSQMESSDLLTYFTTNIFQLCYNYIQILIIASKHNSWLLIFSC